MRKTPVTDRVVGILASMCKKAGYDVPSARKRRIKTAERAVDAAKSRLLARELRKLADARRTLSMLKMKTHQQTTNKKQEN